MSIRQRKHDELHISTPYEFLTASKSSDVDQLILANISCMFFSLLCGCLQELILVSDQL